MRNLRGIVDVPSAMEAGTRRHFGTLDGMFAAAILRLPVDAKPGRIDAYYDFLCFAAFTNRCRVMQKWSAILGRRFLPNSLPVMPLSLQHRSNRTRYLRRLDTLAFSPSVNENFSSFFVRSRHENRIYGGQSCVRSPF